jgi:CNT family concentrative nucleoside transporter
MLLPTIVFAQTTQPAAPLPPPHGTNAERGQSLLGLVAFTFLAFLIGRARGAKGIPWRVIVWGTILEFAFGAIVLFAPGFLELVQEAVQKLLDFTLDGVRLIFGSLAGSSVPVVDPAGHAIGVAQIGTIFAVVVLPTIIFVAMLTAILYHTGIMTAIVHGLAWVMQKSMGTSGAETLSTAANIFVGQTEAPLLVKPFLTAATNSEMMAIMVGGFANIASGVLVVYTDFLKAYIANVGGHLAAACFISAPATLVVSKLMMPETTTPLTAGGVKFKVERIDANLIDAATRGTTEGMALAINVGAMLITFTALIAMLDAIIVKITGHTLEQFLGYIMSPLAWLSGVKWHEARTVGSLLGVKTVLNEFIAYLQMSQGFAKDPNYLSPRSALLAAYALCGFANFASDGIQIGGISTMAPDRRHDLSRLGLLAMAGGAVASLMGACVVGVLW